MVSKEERNALDTPQRKRELRAELEKAMLDYKGKITVLPNNIGMPRPEKTQDDTEDFTALRQELSDRLLQMGKKHRVIASVLGLSLSQVERMIHKDVRVSHSQVKIALSKVRNYEQV